VRRSSAFLGVLMVLCAFGASAEPGIDAFFRPAPPQYGERDSEGVYPQGQRFPFSFFSTGGSVESEEARQAVFERVKGAGIPLIGPQYELNRRVLEDAQTHGFRAVYQVGLPMRFTSDEPLRLTPDEIAEGIAEQVRAVADRPEIAWWYLQPEELRHWRRREMEYLETATRTIRELDPRERPIWMYDPGHRTANALAHTVQHLSICGKGMYTNYSGQRDSRIWVRWTIEQEIEAIERANPGAIPIAVPEMFQQPEDEHLEWITAWVRHDVYLSLVSGAKGIIVFSLRERNNFDAHAAYAEAYLEAARELCGDLALGQLFLFGERRDDLTVQVVQGPAVLALDLPLRGERPAHFPSVNYANLAWGSERYLFAVNSANERVRVRVTGFPENQIRAVSVFDDEWTALIEEGGVALEFAPLEVKGLQLVKKESG